MLDYDRALELEPEDALAFTYRGACKADLGRLEEAIADHDRALALDPQLGLAWANRGICRQELGRLREAIADYDRALELSADEGYRASVEAKRAAAAAQLRAAD